LKCDGTRAETRFRLSAKRTRPFKSAGASVQSTTGSRAVGISGSNAGYTIFRGSMKGTGYPLHSRVSPSLPLPCVTVGHHISTGLPKLRSNLSVQGCLYHSETLVPTDTTWCQKPGYDNMNPTLTILLIPLMSFSLCFADRASQYNLSN